MIVGLIGSGGREHAICEILKRSKKVNKIYQYMRTNSILAAMHTTSTSTRRIIGIDVAHR